jgi:two-component system, OmpR family, response regulator TctD
MMHADPVKRLYKNTRVFTRSTCPKERPRRTRMQLLLIEDDPALQRSLERSLLRSGIQVRVCGDGAKGLAQWQRERPDVVVLDLSLPSMDGLDVLAQGRRAGLETPVLILTARGTVGDRVIGLNAGADDYLAKPFDLDELEARIRALYRRSPAGAAEPETPHWGSLRLDPASGAFHHGHQVLDLPPRELRLLQVLTRRAGHAVTREQLLETVFEGEADVQPEAVEVVVYRLRKKLAATGVTIMTLRGLGYLLKA